MFRIILFFALIGCGLTHGQSSGSIYGRVTDAEIAGAPLPFANVALKGTAVAAHTNLDGNFEIEGINPGKYVLRIDYLGYEPKEIAIEVKAAKVVMVEKSLQIISLATADLVLTEATSPMDKSVDKATKH